MNERNDDFRSRVGIAGDVTGKIPHIGDDDCGFPNGRRPAYPLAKLNSSAGGLTLKRPENQLFPSAQVETYPVYLRQRMVDQRRSVSRVGDEVGFILQQGLQLPKQ